MKNTSKKIIFLFILILTFFSCQEEFLDSEPRDFIAPENAFESIEGFEGAVGALLNFARREYTRAPGIEFWFQHVRTDLSWLIDDEIDSRMAPANITTEDSYVLDWWEFGYQELMNASNVLIHYAEKNDHVFQDVEQQNRYIAIGKFFRAYTHYWLVNLWGGVPIIDELQDKPRYDYKRNTREEVLQFARQDLKFASKWLPTVNEIPSDRQGSITKAAAQHLLTTVYLALAVKLKEIEPGIEEYREAYYDSAIISASAIIQSGNYRLMTERFGSRKDEPGDVFHDLFLDDNTNRTDGNFETIWALQFKWNTTGGGAIVGSGIPTGGIEFARVFGPWYTKIPAPGGTSDVDPMIRVDSITYGNGWAALTDYMANQVWEEHPEDMRNSKYNIRREWYYTNPESPYFKQKVDPTTFPATYELRSYYPQIRKIDGHQIYTASDNNPMVATDFIKYRFAETYLLRAEAYLGAGMTAEAAADINVVRNRAQVTPVTPGEVTIDYILDERARELSIETHRRATLVRLGKYVEYIRKYNPQDANDIQDFHRYWPIPQATIDLNSDHKIRQNHGYQ
jgi:hypothetical protein